ncbi:MAG: DUF2332 domain-containing protein [Candidatus Eremiobacteraeota bacterium]|nr:DUF2332 domain-containing protein [Candidatus Eremiobacteraeota bacterium]MBC5804025.1 DUF2332 domain-containing protein [Candidatus Eremiobacteraeota bacterium]MBC5820424.1 DUF2332 domain-containing protein [Candidatus Eremiobacteraeota bacterium]
MESLVSAFKLQAQWCYGLGSPLYGALLERCAADLRSRRGPLGALLAPHGDDPPESALALRLMAAVHRLALAGEAPALARHYPSCGGDGDAIAAWAAFSNVIAAEQPMLHRGLLEPVQTNEVSRAAALLGGFLMLAARFGRPLRLLELGASAGFLLRWDKYRYRAGEWTWGPPSSPVCLDEHFADATLPFNSEALPVAIAERRGCDLAPIDATSEAGSVRLRSFVWADQRDRLARLDAACSVARSVAATVDRADAPAWLAEKLAEPSPGTVTIVFHAVVMQYLSKNCQTIVDAILARAGEHATSDAPLARLSLEPRSGPNVVLQLWPSGEEIGLARASLHGGDVTWQV